ncbi:hypothetical protein KBB96_03600 [Luteolibacter ambystomatis]|uniref:Uncharacterized protein n=1 Tax=Luteolibacter ambystomatis TaxID=2824561 RepID=A0A975J0W4_9BACT|nr:hypothetical protein [Luteolibacter ambystomatis]QUE51978.1 hypothetical protein KBB96_03600 [Luteolibacter ambystomatis]
MSKHQKTVKRVEILAGLLKKTLEAGEDLFVDDLLKAFETVEREPPDSWLRMIANVISSYNKNSKVRSIAISPDNRRIQYVEPPVPQFEERLHKQANEKHMVCMGLLHWLFDATDVRAGYGATEKSVPKAFEKGMGNYPLEKPLQARFNWARTDPAKSFIERRLQRKRNAARNRTVLSLMVDSGSTTYTCMERFLAAREFPLKVPINALDGVDTSDGEDFEAAEEEPKKLRHRKVEPSILTNSLAISELIGKDSNLHRRRMILRVIGGTERPERRSLSGDVSLLWTRMLKSMGGVDLSIVGTTGILENRHGDWSLYMDDPIECELKREFLHMAGFKIVICDSLKVLEGSCLHEFAPIHENSVDLIVIDDPFPNGYRGADRERHDRFQSFLESAREQNVGVMAISLAKTRKQDT